MKVSAKKFLDFAAHSQNSGSDSHRILRKHLLENSVKLPGVVFAMGSDNIEEGPRHIVELSAYHIAKSMITNLEYAYFLNAECVQNELDGTYVYLNTINKMCRIEFKKDKLQPKPGYEAHPVSCVNWFGAIRFAKWVGGRLPTEAEWEYAASSGAENTFPWGNEQPTPEFANYAEYVGDTTQIDSYPPNTFGLFDMAGNLCEWCSDWYSLRYYPQSEKKNPSGPILGTDRVVRGGSWSYSADKLRCRNRDRRWPRVGYTTVGFRIVFD